MMIMIIIVIAIVIIIIISSSSKRQTGPMYIRVRVCAIDLSAVPLNSYVCIVCYLFCLYAFLVFSVCFPVPSIVICFILYVCVII